MKSLTEARVEILAPRGVPAIAALVGLSFFGYYCRLGLTTAHYDAKAHLMLARRIIDAFHPGYAQMGAHWLPLLHVLYLPLVVFDSQYRSAVMPSLISVCAFVLSAWLVYLIARRLTGSPYAGLFASAILIANPNIEYLQSAPLTEPVFMALMLLAFDALMRWREEEVARLPWLAALWTSLGALCRYEGWLLLAGILALLAWDMVSRTLTPRRALRGMAVFLGVFALPMMAHFGYIFVRLGDSFFQRVARGNPAPYETLGNPFLAGLYHFGELAQAAALIPLIMGLAGVFYCMADRVRLRRSLPYFLLWLPSGINVAALTWGLMYRVRYSSLLIPAIAVFAALAFSHARVARRLLIVTCTLVAIFPVVPWYFPPQWQYHMVRPGPGFYLMPAAALLVLLAAVAGGRYRWGLVVLSVLGMQVPAFSGEVRPMMAEALEHRYIEPERHQVMEFLQQHYDGSRILIDMGRLAPMMYDSGLPLREFLCRDGDPSEWQRAVANPRNEVGWLVAQQGDEVWNLLHVDPRWARGYALAVQTENYVIFQLVPDGRDGAFPDRQIE